MSEWTRRLMVVAACLLITTRAALADTNLKITAFGGGYLTWTNVNSNLYYSVQWLPSLAGTNDCIRSEALIVSHKLAIAHPVEPVFTRHVGVHRFQHGQQFESITSLGYV